MELQLFYKLSFIFIWIFVLFFASMSSGNDVPKIYLDNTVFVAFKGENLTIRYKLMKPSNQSQAILRCFDPSGTPIYSKNILGTGEQSFVLENMVTSGEYHCQYNNANAYWFLRVRDHGYKNLVMLDYTDIIVAVFTGVLLVFSVVGSVYVFRGHWKCGNAGDERMQNREERKVEDNTNEVSSSSTSFYASLEPRPRSIYDVLDYSAANTQPQQTKHKPKKDKTRKPYDELRSPPANTSAPVSRTSGSTLVCFCTLIMAAEGDFLARYRAVSNKLKKRFLRKPNVAEASEQFGQLAKELKQQDCLQYAAFCNLAMARCEQTLFNAPGEALALTDAARLFLTSEKENRALQAPGFDEHLQAALNCYSFAIKVYIEMNQPVMAASLCLELGNALKEMNRPGEAIVHYQRAAELQTQTPIEALLSMGEMATCKILTRDYDGALSVFTEMQLTCQERGLQLPGTNTPVGAFLDVVAKCEISRVLLLMLLEPPPQKLLPEHAQTLERYAWESFDPHSQVTFLPENVFLLLQSVVMACQEKDTESLKSLQTELWPFLTAEQNHLLHLVVQERITPSGQGI